jgi:hypothetical protein
MCRLLLESEADIRAKNNESAPSYRDDYFYAAKLRFSFQLVFVLVNISHCIALLITVMSKCVGSCFHRELMFRRRPSSLPPLM